MNSNSKTNNGYRSLGNYLSLVLTALCLAGSTILGSFASTTALLLFVAGNLTGVPAHAQTLQPDAVGDINPPVIELETIDSGVAGQDQVFTALVADNGNLLDVKLYYRFMGQQAYQNVVMQPLAADTDFYLATITTNVDDTRTIEYYIQARDVAGNRIVEGFAFEPLLRTLSAAQTNGDSNAGESIATTSQSPQIEPEASSGGIKIWQIVLGVLAVGALAGAAASSGGNGGGGGDNPAPQTVPLTITIGAP